MRQALNENPRVQLAVLGAVGLIFALLLFGGVIGGSSEDVPDAAVAPTDPAAPGAPADPAAPAAGAAAPTEPGAAAETPSGAAPAPSAVAPPAGSVGALEAGEGLPRPVVSTLEGGDAAVLYVYDPQALADSQLRAFVERLRTRDDLELFPVQEREVAEYSRITEGVSLDRTPALIVVAPPEGGATPEATISYGFRRSRSLEQAVDDALYDGRRVTPYPR